MTSTVAWSFFLIGLASGSRVTSNNIVTALADAGEEQEEEQEYTGASFVDIHAVKSGQCPTPAANSPITGTWAFMNDVEADPHTLFHIYGDEVAAKGKRQFLVMAAMPGKPGSGKYKLKMPADGNKNWGMTYYVVKGSGCAQYTKTGCKVDKDLFGSGHSDGDNTPSSAGWLGFFGTGWGSSTNKYKIPSAAVPGDKAILLEPCQYDTKRVCALVEGTSCYLKRIHVCAMDGDKATDMQLEGITRDGSGSCSL